MQNARLQTGHRVQQGHGGDFASGHHKVAQADLLVYKLVNKALVHALITSAEQDSASTIRPLLHRGVLQRWANRREKHQRRRVTILATLCANRFQASGQGFGHHHHAGSAAKGPVVDPAVIALRIVARIPEFDLDLTRFIGTARDATD